MIQNAAQALLFAGDKAVRILIEQFITERCEHTIGVENGFDDSLIVDQAESAVEDAVSGTDFLKHIGERPVGE